MYLIVSVFMAGTLYVFVNFLVVAAFGRNQLYVCKAHKLVKVMNLPFDLPRHSMNTSRQHSVEINCGFSFSARSF